MPIPAGEVGQYSSSACGQAVLPRPAPRSPAVARVSGASGQVGAQRLADLVSPATSARRVARNSPPRSIRVRLARVAAMLAATLWMWLPRRSPPPRSPALRPGAADALSTGPRQPVDRRPAARRRTPLRTASCSGCRTAPRPALRSWRCRCHRRRRTCLCEKPMTLTCASSGKARGDRDRRPREHPGGLRLGELSRHSDSSSSAAPVGSGSPAAPAGTGPRRARRRRASGSRWSPDRHVVVTTAGPGIAQPEHSDASGLSGQCTREHARDRRWRSPTARQRRHCQGCPCLRQLAEPIRMRPTRCPRLCSACRSPGPLTARPQPFLS